MIDEKKSSSTRTLTSLPLDFKILVVEDTYKHIEAAKRQFEGLDLTIVSGYDQAVEQIAEPKYVGEGLKLFQEWQAIAKKNPRESTTEEKDRASVIKYNLLPAHKLPKYDAVLTDLMMPKGGRKCMGNVNSELLLEEAPNGYPIVLQAMNVKIKYIALLSEGNHHEHPMWFSLDNASGIYRTEHSILRIYACHECPTEEHEGEYRKNWKRALESLIEEK